MVIIVYSQGFSFLIMPISIMQWHVKIGMFDPTHKTRFINYVKECLILEVSINNKRGYVVSLYRSPSQTSDEFDSFITNLEKNVVDISRSNPHFLLLIGD